MVEPGSHAHSQIVAYFGNEILRPDGALDRAKLGAVIFNDAEKRKKLNTIVHPAVRKAMVRDILRCWVKGNRICVVDVPLLIEAGLDKWVAKVVVVSWYALHSSESNVSLNLDYTVVPKINSWNAL